MRLARVLASSVLFLALVSHRGVVAQSVSGQGFKIATFAGLAGSVGAVDATGSDARFFDPAGIAVDTAGALYVVEATNNTVRKITPAGVVTTLAGLAGAIGSVDGTGSDARFSDPEGIAVAADGTIYVADTGNSTIRKITPAGIVTTLAGQAGVLGSEDGAGAAARFRNAKAVAVDAAGNVYVGDTGNATIRKITPAGVVTTLAGVPLQTGAADGLGPEGTFFTPTGIAVAGDGTIYVGDELSHTVRKITPDGFVTTLAGLAGFSGTADGTGSDARLFETEDVAVDAAGNVYVADEGNFTIRKINSAGVVTTIAGGAGLPGAVDATGAAARFDELEGIAIDSAGVLYIADMGNDTIRKGVRQELVANGDFSGGRTGWFMFDEQDVVWSVVTGVFQFHKADPPTSPSQQATVFQPTWMPMAAGAPLAATFDLGNTSTTRKRLSVLLIDSNFSDISVCTFWLPPNVGLRTYGMRTHTTRAWENGAIYFYAASDNTNGDNGNYLLDNVSVRDGLASQPATRTDCVDPGAPPSPGATGSADLLSNGGFDNDVLAPWSLFGDLTQRITGGVFEFFRPGASATAAGVVFQATGSAMTANQVMTATFQLGNSSLVRKRVTVLMHDLDFSDLAACTFWLAPGETLSTYTMRSFASKAWSNATLSFYAATTGTESWIRLDNVTFERTAGVTTVGTECGDPSPGPVPGSWRLYGAAVVAPPVSNIGGGGSGRIRR